MPIRLWTNNIGKIFLGNQKIKKVYLWSTLLYNSNYVEDIFFSTWYAVNSNGWGVSTYSTNGIIQTNGNYPRIGTDNYGSNPWLVGAYWSPNASWIYKAVAFKQWTITLKYTAGNDVLWILAHKWPASNGTMQGIGIKLAWGYIWPVWPYHSGTENKSGGTYSMSNWWDNIVNIQINPNSISYSATNNSGGITNFSSPSYSWNGTMDYTWLSIVFDSPNPVPKLKEIHYNLEV